MGNSAARLHETQEDLARTLRTLAQQVENVQSGTTPGSMQSTSTAPIVMEVEDLNGKATLFNQAFDQNKRAIDTLVPLREQVQHLEAEIEAWQI